MDFFLANCSPTNLHTNRQLQQQQRRWTTKKSSRNTRTGIRASNAAPKTRKSTPLEAEQQQQKQQQQQQQSQRHLFVKMNLLMVCVLLLIALVCQPTLIYGLRGSQSASAAVATAADQRSVKTFGGKVKRSRAHSLHASAAELANVKLVMALESGDVLVRRAARGANADGVDDSATPIDAAVVGGGGGKRNKNGNNNNKKLNKGTDATNGGRSKQEKRYSATIGSQAQQQQQQQHGHHGSGNGKGRQRQQPRSQQHQGHGKRGGIGGNGNGGNSRLRTESVEKTATAEKSQSSCRYSKSAWTECDPKTNVRTRTLTLKKGEANCLATRQMQKKCKKPCRYEKGAWSECINGQMTRQDKLKSTITANSPGATEAVVEPSCEPIRNINKKCSPGGTKMANKANKDRKHKEKGQRRAQQQAQ